MLTKVLNGLKVEMSDEPLSGGCVGIITHQRGVVPLALLDTKLATMPNLYTRASIEVLQTIGLSIKMVMRNPGVALLGVGTDNKIWVLDASAVVENQGTIFPLLSFIQSNTEHVDGATSFLQPITLVLCSTEVDAAEKVSEAIALAAATVVLDLWYVNVSATNDGEWTARIVHPTDETFLEHSFTIH